MFGRGWDDTLFGRLFNPTVSECKCRYVVKRTLAGCGFTETKRAAASISQEIQFPTPPAKRQQSSQIEFFRQPSLECADRYHAVVNQSVTLFGASGSPNRCAKKAVFYDAGKGRFCLRFFRRFYRASTLTGVRPHPRMIDCHRDRQVPTSRGIPTRPRSG